MRVWSAERVFVKGRFERDWALMVDDGGTIQAVGPRRQLVSKAQQVAHYPQAVILPSFVNPHHHGFHAVFRGIADQVASFNDLLHRLVWPLSRVIDPELFEALYRIAFADQALSGVSTVTEFHYLHNGAVGSDENPRFADRIIEIALELGLRINLVYAFFDQGVSEETQAFIESLDVSMKNFEALLERYRDHPMVNVIPGIHSLEHTSSEAIVAAGELAQKHDLPLHIQLAEREGELEKSNVQFGTTPLRALDKMGLVNERLVVINGTLLDDDELALLKEKRGRMVICPTASLAKGDDLPNVYGLLQHGIPFAIGSDSVCNSNSFSPPGEIALIEFLQRGQQSAFNILNRQLDVQTLWDLATSLPAEMVATKSGSLMPGTPADFMVVNIDNPSFRPRWNFSTELYMNQLVFGWGPQVGIDLVVVNGAKVVSQRNVIHCEQLNKSFDQVEQWSEAFMRSIDRTAPESPNPDSSQLASGSTAS